ncbi:hypothetical protein E1293_35185 [Actinomadura darangshiensis]|uniref:Abi family protein n=1 Tax=Actinomadura darangshiensis TaxID=705336 RepID=A0A4R5AC68_9ACTN|nr:hypothetical protein [Actinomadura darangshiensis]TDD69993.1 hypothetical protein E1293_35185 [Actinomadura darangshiensis]
MSAGELDWTRGALSPARLAPYLAAVDGDLAAAMRLYWWNLDASAAFYGPLHWLEITLRNALHAELCRAHGRRDWWASARLLGDGPRNVAQAKSKLRARGVTRPSADDIVAELTFGFWVSLLSRRADRYFWVPALHRAFPEFAGPRRELHAELNTARRFRNRVMHYEPIHHYGLAADHGRVFRLLGYLSPECAAAARRQDGVPDVLARRPDVGAVGDRSGSAGTCDEH